MKYPMIERDNVDFISNSDICNIGFYEGVLNDERPIRCECWFMAGVTTLTCFISSIDLEKDKVLNLLCDNNIIEIIDNDIFIDETIDVNDNSFYSINVPLNNGDKICNKCLVELKDF